MKYVSCLFISSDQKSLRSSIILLLIKYLNLFLKFCLVVESWLWWPLTARLISEMLLRKTVLGNEQLIPRPFLIHHSTQEWLANSQIHSFKKISIWKVANGEKNCNFFEFLKLLLWISLRVGYCWKAYSLR